MSNLSDYAKDELKRIGMIDSGEPYEDRPQGHWINNHNNTISCDRCHTWFNKDDRYRYMSYCPYCNAEMSEIPTGSEGSDKE